MRLCIGTAKGIVILDPSRGAIPLMVLADPSAVWCMAQDAVDPNLIYAGSTEHIRGKGTLARTTDGGRTWTDVTPPLAREEEVWSLAASPAVQDRVFLGTSHARLFRSDDRGRIFRECDGFLKIPGRDRWTFPPPPHLPHAQRRRHVRIAERRSVYRHSYGRRGRARLAAALRHHRRRLLLVAQCGQIVGAGEARTESHVHHPAAGQRI